MYIKSDQIYFKQGIRDGYLEIENSRIVAFHRADAGVKSFLDYTGYRIIPGIIDTHNHGTRGYGVINADCNEPEEEVRGFLKGCAANGITGVFPTAAPAMCKYIEKVSREQLGGAKILGIHSEGPYLNRVGEGGIYVEPPTVDLELVKKIYEDSEGLLKLMAIAPEIPNSQKVIDYLREKGVKLSFAHSNCDYDEAMKAFENGLSVSTHTGNVMSGIHHRNMGGLGACLLNEKIQCEIICDGLHINPVMIDLMFRLKSPDHWMMISDSSEVAGAPVGDYRFWDFVVHVDEQGFCKSETGRLMGSTKSVLYGLSVLVNELCIPLEKVIRLSSLNAARFYGFGDHKGSIEINKDADFVVIDAAYNAIATFVEGRKVFDFQTDKDFFNKTYLQRHWVDKI
ncbi:MAG: amidohydrolase family protein [Anaerolineaceae bacterium]|jgi:N-acetylglucosamine-6-phosphate deacetylase